MTLLPTDMIYKASTFKHFPNESHFEAVNIENGCLAVSSSPVYVQHRMKRRKTSLAHQQ